jgi:hypothetical protein
MIWILLLQFVTVGTWLSQYGISGANLKQIKILIFIGMITNQITKIGLQG